MKCLVRYGCWVLIGVVAATAAMANPIELHAIDFPERATIAVHLAPEPGAPEAKMDAKVAYKDRAGHHRFELCRDEAGDSLR